MLGDWSCQCCLWWRCGVSDWSSGDRSTSGFCDTSKRFSSHMIFNMIPVASDWIAVCTMVLCLVLVYWWHIHSLVPLVVLAFYFVVSALPSFWVTHSLPFFNQVCLAWSQEWDILSQCHCLNSLMYSLSLNPRLLLCMSSVTVLCHVRMGGVHWWQHLRRDMWRWWTSYYNMEPQ